jgi:hypothetical protein
MANQNFSFHTCSRQSHIMVHGCLNQSGWHVRSLMVQMYLYLAVSTESFRLLLHQLRTSFFDTSMIYFLDFHMQAICACMCLCVYERCPKLVHVANTRLRVSMDACIFMSEELLYLCTLTCIHPRASYYAIIKSISSWIAHSPSARLRVLLIQNHLADHSMIMPM